jgi:hypothetical protein
VTPPPPSFHCPHTPTLALTLFSSLLRDDDCTLLLQLHIHIHIHIHINTAIASFRRIRNSWYLSTTTLTY